MPATTTAINACDVAVYIANAAGVLTDISGSANKVDLAFSQEVGNFRVFGDKWMRRLACAKDATMSLDVVYTTTADEGLDLLRDWMLGASSGTPRAFRVILPQNAVGSDSYEGSVIISSLSIPIDASEAGPIMCSAELMPNGAITHSVTTT